VFAAAGGEKCKNSYGRKLVKSSVSHDCYRIKFDTTHLYIFY
jgi:hypothetical protein